MKIAWLFLCLVAVVGRDMASRAEESEILGSSPAVSTISVREAPSGPSGGRAIHDGRAIKDGVAINEILADPPDGEDGDANQDGERSTYGDEFVEIFNAGPDTANLRGWRIADAVDVRHAFPESIDVILPPGQFLTIFGGGVPAGFDGAVWVASSGRLSLNNTDDRVALVSASGDTVDVHTYGAEAGHNESLIRVPDGSGEWTRPSLQEWDWRFSPQEPNRGETGIRDASWGQVKRQYHVHG